VFNALGSAPFFSVLSVMVLGEFRLDFNDEFFVRGLGFREKFIEISN